MACGPRAGLSALPRRLTGVGMALIILVAINVMLLAAYLWSRGGETTHVRVEARGVQFSAFVDGNATARGVFHTADQGGVFLKLDHLYDVPSLPNPRGIASVRVTDLTSGAVLYEHRFSSGLGAEWTAVDGVSVSGDGVASASGSGTLGIRNPGWRDYAVDVTYKNVSEATIMVRTDDGQSGVAYHFRSVRDFDSDLTLLDHGSSVTSASGGRLMLKRTELVKSLAAMALRPYPLIGLLFVAGLAMTIALGLVQVPGALRRRLRLPSGLSWLAAALVAAGAFGVTLWLNYSLASHMPHIPDEISYIFEAKLLASGRVFASPPPVSTAFDYFFPPYIAVSHGKWASVYPFGHPLMLALGVRLGAVWLIPPLVGAASVVLLFAIGRRLYGARPAFVAALLFAVSPFFLMMTSSFMSHTTAAFYLLLSLLCLVFIERRPLLYGVIAGVCFGLLFNTRPLTGTALVPAFGLLLLSRFFPRTRWKSGLQGGGAFVTGGLVMLGAFLLYNYGTTGDALTSGYRVPFQQVPEVSCAVQVCSDLAAGVGFGGRHTATAGIENEQTQLSLLLLVLNGWPAYVGLMFVLAPFVLATRKLWDWFLLSCVVSVMAAWIVFEGTGIVFGPRYWYDIVPLFMLLSARGAERMAELLATAARIVHRRISTGSSAPSPWASVVVVYALVLALIGGEFYGWVFGQRTGWHATFVPERLTLLRGFNGVDDRLVTVVDHADLHNALVLVESCPGWQCYGNLAWRNSPDLDGAVVFARDLPDRRAELFGAYPDRRVYVANFAEASLVPFGTPAASTPRPLAEAPFAKDITLSQPAPDPTPNPLVTRLRDEQRQQDLALLARSLQQYFARHVTYPVGPALQAICATPLDAGCALREVLDPLPLDPSPSQTYLYQSDGASFILVALLENVAPANACPDPPSRLRLFSNVYCVRSPAPSAP